MTSDSHFAGPTTIGDRVAELMAAAGLSQTDLATKTGIDRSEINRIVRNRRPPRWVELPFLAPVLNTTVEDLLRGVELTPEYRRNLEKMQEGAMRLLKAEAERDEERQKAARLRESLQEAGMMIDHERTAFAEERQRLVGDAARERQRFGAECAERLARAERDRASVEVLLGAARLDAFQKGARAAELEGTVAALREEVQTLQTRLADENSAKVFGAVLSGIAGMASGAFIQKLNQSEEE